MKIKTFIIMAICATGLSCAGNDVPQWKASELGIINGPSEVLPVWTVADSTQEAFLRLKCDTLSIEMINSSEYSKLVSRMLTTVTDSTQNGVGIAGPQVGISRRVVCVQRFDKEGEPFESYPNIRIVAKRGEDVPGPEGCLSVPNCRGDVLRSRDIDVSYYSLASGSYVTERVEGFTAVIFQHECDHLDGILYTDKIIK